MPRRGSATAVVLLVASAPLGCLTRRTYQELESWPIQAASVEWLP